jgi:hypothetical protein
MYHTESQRMGCSQSCGRVLVKCQYVLDIVGTVYHLAILCM